MGRRVAFKHVSILGDPGAVSGTEGKPKRAEKMAREKSHVPTICPAASEDAKFPIPTGNGTSTEQSEKSITTN